MSSKRYPLDEGVKFRFSCPGCEKGYSTSVPKHSAPFTWRCPNKGCDWTMNIQTDPAGISVGFTAPLRQKPALYLVDGGEG